MKKSIKKTNEKATNKPLIKKSIITAILASTMITSIVGCKNDSTGDNIAYDDKESHMISFEGKVLEVLDDYNTVKLKITKGDASLIKGNTVILENYSVTLEDNHNDSKQEATSNYNYILKKGDIVKSQIPPEEEIEKRDGMRVLKTTDTTTKINTKDDKTKKDLKEFPTEQMFEGKVTKILKDYDKTKAFQAVKVKLTKTRGNLKKDEEITLEYTDLVQIDFQNSKEKHPKENWEYKLKEGDKLGFSYSGEEDLKEKNGDKIISANAQVEVFVNTKFKNK